MFCTGHYTLRTGQTRSIYQRKSVIYFWLHLSFLIVSVAHIFCGAGLQCAFVWASAVWVWEWALSHGLSPLLWVWGRTQLADWVCERGIRSRVRLPFFDGKRSGAPTAGHWWYLRVIQNCFPHVSMSGAGLYMFPACSLTFICLFVYFLQTRSML